MITSKNRLKQVIVAEGITQAELSRKCGLSTGTINRACNQVLILSPTSRSKILKAINDLSGKKYIHKKLFGCK